MSESITHSDTQKKYGSENSLPLIIIERDNLYCVISLQGAQILELSVDKQNLLWLSPMAKFEKNKSIRGGIPICAPWFGPHDTDKDKPKHGFIRNNLWALDKVEEEHDGVITLKLSYDHIPDELFPHAFALRYIIKLSHKLELALTIENTAENDLPFSWAFHSYHPVESIETATISGLENIEYLDATENFTRKTQKGVIEFEGELDRIYENVPQRQKINTIRPIAIKAENCPSAIIWNPGCTLAKTMSDVGEEGYKKYVCLERGAVRNNALNIAKNAIYTGSACICFEDKC